MLRKYFFTDEKPFCRKIMHTVSKFILFMQHTFATFCLKVASEMLNLHHENPLNKFQKMRNSFSGINRCLFVYLFHFRNVI